MLVGSGIWVVPLSYSKNFFFILEINNFVSLCLAMFYSHYLQDHRRTSCFWHFPQTHRSQSPASWWSFHPNHVLLPLLASLSPVVGAVLFLQPLKCKASNCYWRLGVDRGELLQGAVRGSISVKDKIPTDAPERSSWLLFVILELGDILFYKIEMSVLSSWAEEVGFGAIKEQGKQKQRTKK